MNLLNIFRIFFKLRFKNKSKHQNMILMMILSARTQDYRRSWWTENLEDQGPLRTTDSKRLRTLKDSGP